MPATDSAPQFTTYRKTHEKFGTGRVCLYAARGGLPPVVNTPTAKELKKLPWWLVHYPSRKCGGVATEAEGVRVCEQAKLGVEVLGLMPEIKPKGRARVRADRSEGGQKGGQKADAAEEDAPKRGGGKRGRKKLEFTADMTFDQKMGLAFPDERIILEINELLQAEEDLVVQGAVVGSKPHFQTRFQTLKMLIEHNKGRPVEKLPATPPKKTVSWEELKTMITTSESARMVMRGLIEEAEAVKPAAHPAAPVSGGTNA